jgi:protein-arginine kinase
VDQGVLPEVPGSVLNRAMLGAQSGHLALAAGRALAGRERGEARAAYLRDLLGADPA